MDDEVRALRAELRTAYDHADDLGEFLVAIFERQEMGDAELSLVAIGKIANHRRWQADRLVL